MKGGEDSITQKGATIDDITGYVPLWHEGSTQVKLLKNQRYPIKMLAMPKGVHVTMNIVSYLIELTYNDHDILTYLECTEEPYKKQAHGEGGSVVRVLQ